MTRAPWQAGVAAGVFFHTLSVQAEPDAAATLQSPEQVSLHNSAYSLPAETWGFDAGALGLGGGDIYAELGVAYGFGAGLQAEVNVAHVGMGLLNASGRWHFVDTRYFDLGASLGVWYGRGEWLWILQPPAKKLVSGLSMVRVPVGLTASTQLTSFLELDLGLEYAYAHLFGSVGNEESWFIETELGVQRITLRPEARFFVSDSTALEVLANLPPYTAVPREGDDLVVPFSETWSIEAGVRSRFTEGWFGTVRLHYGTIAETLYDARLYPSFEVEARF